MTVALHTWNVFAIGLWLLFLSTRLHHIADKESAGELAVYSFAGFAGSGFELFVQYVASPFRQLPSQAPGRW